MMSAVEDIYYSKCLGFLIIFAVDDRESFHNATTRHFEKILRVKDAEDNEDVPHNIPIILVGNKVSVVRNECVTIKMDFKNSVH